jgi:outer membrane protein OmpA-like peptidoglycan-associated protein
MSINFAKRATGIEAADRARLGEKVRSIESIGRELKYGKPCVFVQGIADASEGTKRQQLQLSLERAQAVGKLLQRYGMPEGYIFLDAKGAELRFFPPPDLRNAVANIDFLLC